jgi:hypothetical protein
MGRVKCDHIKRLITLTSDNIKRLSLYCDSFIISLELVVVVVVAAASQMYAEVDTLEDQLMVV